jgi:flavorubredoxin
MMADRHEAVHVAGRVYWVGAVDGALREFHGYSTPRGTTYNAYIILADKVTLVDTVKAPFYDEMIERIMSVIDPGRIDYIVSNHAEMDHSGCLPRMISRVSPEKVFASPMGIKGLREQFNWFETITPVKTGDVLDLGNEELQFIETRMLHWPDSMVSYLPSEKILFTQDAFGMHLASEERFEDEVDWDTVRYESAKYYANILAPYSKLILNVLETLKNSGMDIQMLASDHGPIWRRNIQRIYDLYEKWSLKQPEKKVVIVYDTMWGSTARMAEEIARGVEETGIDVKLFHLNRIHRSDVATELLEAGAVLIGAPTINSNMYPSVADVLTYIRGLRFTHLLGGVFGSYGWGGEGTRQVKEMLEAMGVQVIAETRAKYVPDEVALSECYSMGVTVADRLKGEA